MINFIFNVFVIFGGNFMGKSRNYDKIKQLEESLIRKEKLREGQYQSKAFDKKIESLKKALGSLEKKGNIGSEIGKLNPHLGDMKRLLTKHSFPSYSGGCDGARQKVFTDMNEYKFNFITAAMSALRSVLGTSSGTSYDWLVPQAVSAKERFDAACGTFDNAFKQATGLIVKIDKRINTQKKLEEKEKQLKLQKEKEAREKRKREEIEKKKIEVEKARVEEEKRKFMEEKQKELEEIKKAKEEENARKEEFKKILDEKEKTIEQRNKTIELNQNTIKMLQEQTSFFRSRVSILEKENVTLKKDVKHFQNESKTFSTSNLLLVEENEKLKVELRQAKQISSAVKKHLNSEVSKIEVPEVSPPGSFGIGGVKSGKKGKYNPY